MKRNLIIIGFFLVLITGIFLIFKRYNSSKVTYEEGYAEIGSISIKVLATGTVQPENRLEIKPPVAGRVEQVLVKEGEMVKKGQTLAWMSSNERAALIDSARSQGSKELKRWEELFKPTPIIAPINGTIILRSVEEGQSFTTQDAILVISDRLTVKAQVDETDIALIKLKQEAEIVLDSYPEVKIDAHVDQIAFEAKTVNNVTTYIVDVLPDKTPDLMRSGMTANVIFFVNERSNILTIPSDFISLFTGTTTVLVRENEQVIEKKIQVGITDGKKTEVITGLNEGELILKEKKGKIKNDVSTNPFSPMRKRKEKTEKSK